MKEWLKDKAESLRDKTRDDITGHLVAIGIDASLAERNQPEESITAGRPGRSLGLIKVQNSPIKLINILGSRPWDDPHTYKSSILTYSIICLIPNPTALSEKYLK